MGIILFISSLISPTPETPSDEQVYHYYGSIYPGQAYFDPTETVPATPANARTTFMRKTIGAIVWTRPKPSDPSEHRE